jgi:hypothetical protein
MRGKKRKLLVAAVGATTITLGCERVTGNPKGPPTNPDAPPILDARHPDARPPDAGVDAPRPPDAAVDAKEH